MSRAGCGARQSTGVRGWRSAPKAPVVAAAAAGLALISVGLVGCSRASTDSPTGTSRTIRELDRALRHALVAGDAEAVEQALAPDFTIVPPPGVEESRAEYVDSVASGNLDYQEFRAISPVRVRVSGRLAVATYMSHLSVSSGDFRTEHDAWHTHAYERQGDRWRLVWAQATAVGGFPPQDG